jgi:hypothetical protein
MARFPIVEVLALLTCTRIASAEPEWWTQQKRACGLASNLAYNDWDGHCGSGVQLSAPQQPTLSAADLAELARQKRLNDAIDVNNQAVDQQKAGNLPKALKLYEEAAQLDPDNPIIKDNLARARSTAEQVAAYEEYQRRMAPLERAAREEQRAAASRIYRSIQGLADSFAIRPSADGRLALLTDLRNTGRTTPDAFGTRKASPSRVVDPASPEAASDRMQQGFDAAGPLAGSSPVPAIEEPRAVAADPRMIAARRELDSLRADRDRLDAEITRLTQQRDNEKEPAAKQALSIKLEEKTRAKQEKVVEITKSTEKTEKLRRTIEFEVAAPNDQKGTPNDKKP